MCYGQIWDFVRKEWIQTIGTYIVQQNVIQTWRLL